MVDIVLSGASKTAGLTLALLLLATLSGCATGATYPLVPLRPTSILLVDSAAEADAACRELAAVRKIFYPPEPKIRACSMRGFNAGVGYWTIVAPKDDQEALNTELTRTEGWQNVTK